MPMNRALYPPDWDALSLRIRARDQWRCAFCGAEYGFPHPVSGSIVILTVAHLDHDESNNDDSNLAALCAKCHLNHDRPDNRRRMIANQLRAQERAGQLILPIFQEIDR